MYAEVIGEFGVERGGQQVALAGEDDAVFVAAEHGDALPYLGHHRRADEDAAKGLLAQAREAEVGLEAVHLAAVGVAPDDEVHQTQPRLAGLGLEGPGHHDHAGAGAE